MTEFDILCSDLQVPEHNADIVKRILQEFLESEQTMLELDGYGIKTLPELYFSDSRVTERLKVLLCTRNYLVKLPTGLSECINLQQLWCSKNQLKTLPRLNNLTKLRMLACSNNQLELIVGLENCEELEILICNNNRLRELPVEISACTKLEHLTCSNNQLLELPAELALCVNLADISCSGNPLREGTPSTISELQKKWATRPHTKSANKIW